MMPSSTRRDSVLYLLLFVPVILLAFWMRGHALNEYPPGLSNDEAVNTIDGLHIARTGNFVMYEESQGRVEPLFRLAEAIGMTFFGRTIWAMRFTSALMSVLVIALAVWITREMLYEYPREIQLIAGLCAGIAIATMIGHVTLSRSLFRGVMQLPTMMLSMGFVLRGLRRNRWSDFVWSGIWGGITLHVYTAAWFYPPAFIVLSVMLLILRFKQWRQWLPKMAVLGVVAGIIASPLIYMLLFVPEALLNRADDVAGGGNLAQDISTMIGQFLVQGDENPQYNAADMPIIPRILQPLFYVGLLALAIRARKPITWFLAVLLPLLALPALLSNEITHGLRIVGEFAVVPVIIGMGAGLIAWGVHIVLKRPQWILLASLVPLGWLAWDNGTETWSWYTVYYDEPERWRLWEIHAQRLNHNEWFFRVDREDFVAWVNTQTQPMLMPLEEAGRKSTRAWLMDAYPAVTSASADIVLPDEILLVMPWSLEQGDLLDETHDYVLLQDGVITLLPPITEASRESLVANIDTGERIERDGQINFLGYAQVVDSGVIDFETSNSMDTELAVFGGDDIALTGWIGENTLVPDSSYEVVLNWESRRLIGHEYFSPLQLQTQDYERLTSTQDLLQRWVYPTSIWDENSPISQRQRLEIPVDIMPGAYRLTTGLAYDIYPLIEATSNTQAIEGNRVTVAWLKVPQESQPTIPESANEVDVRYADSFALTHIEFADGSEGQLLAQLHWRGLVDRPSIDATIFVHLVDAAGNIVAQSDVRPWNGQYPTFIWDADEVVQTDHVLGFDTGSVELADYTVRVGMYTFPGPVNLSAVIAGEARDDGLVAVGTLEEFFTPAE
ncbi:MAG: glycosyltransferase family 39 protein [Chloroflexota bacterium]